MGNGKETEVFEIEIRIAMGNEEDLIVINRYELDRELGMESIGYRLKEMAKQVARMYTEEAETPTDLTVGGDTRFRLDDF